MKRKKVDYSKKAWTPFVDIPVGDPAAYLGSDVPIARYANSRYDVMVFGGDDAQLGRYVHLSFKDHGRSARHDWRDIQRIKNELVGPEHEAIEIYPAESRLVDSSNQFHIYVFKDWKVPIGFHGLRLVVEGRSKLAPKSEQRPFELRPDDCLTGDEYDVLLEKHRRAQPKEAL